MLTFAQIEARIDREAREGEGFDCPHCGHRHSIDDCEICSAVVSYWGEEPHDFTCSECGKDFKVHEHITRRFEAVMANAED